MAPPRRVLVSALAATAAIGLAVLVGFLLTRDAPAASESGPRVVQPGAPGQPGRTLSDEELSGISPPTHTIADTLFMQRMISHHEQALVMTALVDGRSQHAGVALLAERIEISQRDEIGQMRGWLRERGEPDQGPDAGHTNHAGPMPGLLSAEQLGRLRDARDAEFDRLFLEYMIYHHHGALAMVQQLYTAGGGLEPAADRFAREVTADQSIEIRRMQDLLAELS